MMHAEQGNTDTALVILMREVNLRELRTWMEHTGVPTTSMGQWAAMYSRSVSDVDEPERIVNIRLNLMYQISGWEERAAVRRNRAMHAANGNGFINELLWLLITSRAWYVCWSHAAAFCLKYIDHDAVVLTVPLFVCLWLGTSAWYARQSKGYEIVTALALFALIVMWAVPYRGMSSELMASWARHDNPLRQEAFRMLDALTSKLLLLMAGVEPNPGPYRGVLGAVQRILDHAGVRRSAEAERAVTSGLPDAARQKVQDLARKLSPEAANSELYQHVVKSALAMDHPEIAQPAPDPAVEPAAPSPPVDTTGLDSLMTKDARVVSLTKCEACGKAVGPTHRCAPAQVRTARPKTTCATCGLPVEAGHLCKAAAVVMTAEQDKPGHIVVSEAVDSDKDDSAKKEKKPVPRPPRRDPAGEPRPHVFYNEKAALLQSARALDGVHVSAEQARDFTGDPHATVVDGVIPYDGDARLCHSRNVAEFHQDLVIQTIHYSTYRLTWMAWALVTSVVTNVVATLVAYATNLNVAYTGVAFIAIPLITYVSWAGIEKVMFKVKPNWMARDAYEVVFAPHLVDAVVTEYKTGTDADVVEGSIRQKILRHAGLPIPDTIARVLYAGSEYVARHLVARASFFVEGVARCAVVPLVYY